MLDIHPLGEVFPLIEGAAFDALVADIKANGLMHPITVYDGMVLDGRNRLKACEIAGVAPRYEVYEGDDPLGFVISLNIKRRHLEPGQLAAIAANIANMPVGRHWVNSATSQNKNCDISQGDAAKLVGVSVRTVAAAAVVKDKADPAVFEALMQGRVGAERAAEIAKLPADVGVTLPPPDIVRNHERIKKEVKRAETFDRIQKDAEAAPEWPTERFPVVYADPAWKDEFGPNSRDVDFHYPTMTEEEIASLDLDSITTPDAVLYLWATAHMLKQALNVMARWHFDYRTHIIWGKDKIGLGQWARNKHELLLIGRRGDFPPPPEALRPPSVIDAPVSGHSEKPAIFAEMIESWYPDLPKIELFRRGPARLGWAEWGYEAECGDNGLDSPLPETSEAAMTSRGLLDDDDLTKANPSEDSRPSRGIGDA